MEEIWKDIKGFEGRYQVSNLGRIKKLSVIYYRQYKKGPVLVHKHPMSYVKPDVKVSCKVRLRNTKTGFDKLYDVCYLVAIHFIEGYKDGMKIKHKDGNILNNAVDNLIASWPKTIPNEEWKDIRGFEGRYQISNMGRVRSLDRWTNHPRPIFLKGRMMNPSMNKKRGYVRVSLSDGSRNYTHYEVHRLVALHFVPGYKDGLVVNHINETRTDNRAENLEWCTQAYNLAYSDVSARKRKPVYQYDLDGNFIKKHKCGYQAEIELGFTIVHAIYGSKRGYTHGFLFSLEPHSKEYWQKITKENKSSTRKIGQYDDDGNEIARFNSIKEAADLFGVTITCISNCCKGKSIHAAGYRWKYL